jgi:magnesium transporter
MATHDRQPEALDTSPVRPQASSGQNPKRHAADVAAELEQLPFDDRLVRLIELPLPRRAEVFGYLPLDLEAELAQGMSRSDLAETVTRMPADERADLFNQLPATEQTRLLRDLAQEERDDIRRLTAHAEGSVGAIMTTDYATLGAQMQAQQAVAALRREAPDKETIYRSYILDDERRLIGSIRLHELILASADALVADLMNHTPVSIGLDAGQEDAARMIERYDLFALPVVDEAGRLVGIVTHDDAADAMQAETTEDFHKASTVLPVAKSLRDAGIGMLYSRRIVWLVLLIFGNLFSGAGIAFFEQTILANVALVFFLPLLIDSSGNAGSQSATLMVRALATGDVTLKDWRNLLLREGMVAGALGATMAFIVFPIGIMRGGTDLAMVVGLTMLCMVIFGSLIGMSLPFLFNRLRLDPATASGPLVTTLSDALGVVVYFSIATALLDI